MNNDITVLFVGDIVGEPSLAIVAEKLPELIKRHNAECVIVNGENVVNGKGIAEGEAKILFNAGAHVITTGNHIWEHWKARPLLASNPYVLRPLNYPRENPGRGFTTISIGEGIIIGVLQVQGRVYMQPIDCPFKQIDWAINKMREQTDIILVDFHADATAEKIAMGWYVDGRVSAVLGTHTHVQTNDARVLPGGTAYITDVGMSGPYNSVVGMKTDIAIRRMILQTAHKYELAVGDYRICGAVVTINADTGKATSITPFTEYCNDPAPAAEALAQG